MGSALAATRPALASAIAPCRTGVWPAATALARAKPGCSACLLLVHGVANLGQWVCAALLMRQHKPLLQTRAAPPRWHQTCNQRPA